MNSLLCHHDPLQSLLFLSLQSYLLLENRCGERRVHLLANYNLVLQEKEDEAMYQKGYRKLVCELFLIVEMNRVNGTVMKLLSLIQMNLLILFVTKSLRICITIGILIIRCTCWKFSTTCWTSVMLQLSLLIIIYSFDPWNNAIWMV